MKDKISFKYVYKIVPLLLLFFILTVFCSCSKAESRIDISGEWFFKLDPGDVGIYEQWYHKQLNQEINLPGSLQKQGYGNNVNNGNMDWMVHLDALSRAKSSEKYPSWWSHPMFKQYRQKDNFTFSYFLQPKKHYVGPAWYQRTVDIPQEWVGQKIEMVLERCHWKSDLWIDGQKVGMNDSLITPHVYDLTRYTDTAGRHNLNVRIDNSMQYKIGRNSHIVADHAQTAWNGVIGRMFLRSKPLLWIDDIQVYPDVDDKSANVEITVCKEIDGDQEIKLDFSASSYNTSSTHEVEPLKKKIKLQENKQVVEILYPMGNEVQLWDEFNPSLYLLNVSLTSEKHQITSRKKVSFGMREICAKGTVFEINNKPVFLRGTEEACVFPKTGYPPTDVESWRRIMRICKDYGINHIRFHTWCPPKAAFTAADLEGIYIEVCFFWAKIKDEPSYQFLLRESTRALKQYGNHPSFILLSPGMECFMSTNHILDLLKNWKKDNRRLYSGPANSNWLLNQTLIDAYEYYAARFIGDQDTGRVRFQTRWPPKPDGSYFTTKKPQTTINYESTVKSFGKPILTYEVVQRCSYPNLDITEKFTDFLKPGYIKIAKDQLEERGMLTQAEDFVSASGFWQVQQFKEEIEATLRTDGLAGFQLLAIQDYPGHGTAPLGVVDFFWDNKGYCTGDQFKQFCNTTVPLALMEKRTWKSSENFTCDIEVAHFGDRPLLQQTTICKVVNENGVVQDKTEYPNADISIGNGMKLGNLTIDLSKLESPAMYTLEIELKPSGFKNSWDFWVFPSDISMPKARDITVARQFDDKVINELEKGEKVLLIPEKETIAGDIPQCFSSIYWNTTLTEGGESHTLGILCDREHPVFDSFPTQNHSNWQWYELLVNSRPMILDDWGMENSWPKDYYPLIQPINDWHINRKLAVLAQCRVGKGKLVICSMDIETDLDKRIAARQFRYSLLKYMLSDSFDPKRSISHKQIRSIFKNN